MTPDEKRLLTDLASKIAQTPPPPRDAEAEDFIRRNIGSRPDALYLMTQTVLIQNMALDHAQQEIRELQQRAAAQGPAPATVGGSFLGQGVPPQYPPQQPPPYPQYAQQPQYAPPPPPPNYAASGFGQGSSGPGFLRGAAQTAAGVAAGALAFEGIRSLFSHPSYGLGGGYGFGQTGLMGGAGPVEETVINNYYDSPGSGGAGEAHHHQGQQFADTSDDSQNTGDDTDYQTQDADYDDSSTGDDSSSYDDSSDDVA